MLTVFGTIALDTTRTPFRIESNILGGAATFAAVASSFFTDTSIVGIVGSDFPSEYRSILDKRIDTRGIITENGGKTFHYDSSFDYDLSHRTANKTDLNVIKYFEPVIPSEYVESEYVYLANNDPRQNIKILKYFSKHNLVICDTIEYWIMNSRNKVVEMICAVDGVVINDDEARLLCKNTNLVKCAKTIISWGPSFAIIKKGENGSLLVTEDLVFPASAYPLEEVVDPTGAGDSFAGGFIGHLARKKDFTLNSLKEAVIYGNVMGAFAVEDFGIRRFLSVTAEDVQSRYNEYRNLTQF